MCLLLPGSVTLPKNKPWKHGGDEAAADRSQGSYRVASNKVQVGSRVSFASYIIYGTTQYPYPKKEEAVTKFPLPTTQKELRGWMGLCNQLIHYFPGLTGNRLNSRSC